MAESRIRGLSVRANAELVGLRNYILREAGFNVISTVHDHDALIRIERGECGVLLMCYSMLKEVRQKLAQALRTCCPGSRIVLIANEHIEKPDFADTFIYGVEGWEALIDAGRGAMSAEA